MGGGAEEVNGHRRCGSECIAKKAAPRREPPLFNDAIGVLVTVATLSAATAEAAATLSAATEAAAFFPRARFIHIERAAV